VFSRAAPVMEKNLLNLEKVTLKSSRSQNKILLGKAETPAGHLTNSHLFSFNQ